MFWFPNNLTRWTWTHTQNYGTMVIERTFSNILRQHFNRELENITQFWSRLIFSRPESKHLSVLRQESVGNSRHDNYYRTDRLLWCESLDFKVWATGKLIIMKDFFFFPGPWNYEFFPQDDLNFDSSLSSLIVFVLGTRGMYELTREPQQASVTHQHNCGKSEVTLRCSKEFSFWSWCG